MKNKLLKKALILSLITIIYNIIEGLVSVSFGYEDDTLALLGFGVDSFVEVISGIGILHFVYRMKFNEIIQQDKFERTALRITGYAFYLLTIGLIAGVVINLLNNVSPDTTFVGIIISSISIVTMYYLMNAKLHVGKELKSDAIIADANCTRTCFYLSFILLASSVIFELTGIRYIDLAGTLGIAFFAFKEGKEALEKARSGNLACNCH